MTIDIQTLSAGSALPEQYRYVSQEYINKYAIASRDMNPIHIDPEFAAGTELGGTVAHGMLVLAYISSYMTALFSEHWLTGGGMDIRFKSPSRPGDTLKIAGTVTRIIETDGTKQITVEILCANQNNEVVITGEGSVKLKTG